ncbi:MAG: LPS export ABC transporter periplasmic protein LptC [Deltaproteobacteria bacterium]|nr:MAG: LPS export ABC transporter periplasmic protein LptC [Deltaproteobacteria bacterium]
MNLFRPRNLLLLLALLLAGVLVAVVLMRYRPHSAVEEVARVLPSGIDMALQDINYTHTEGGVTRWRLVAKQVEHQAAEKFTSLGDLQVTFYDVKGVEQGTLKARKGRVNADFSVVEVSDSVEFTSVRGYTLTTDYLTYRQEDRTIRTDAPVRLVSAKVRLDGVGMSLGLGTRSLRIASRVRAVVNPDHTTKGSL